MRQGNILNILKVRKMEAIKEDISVNIKETNKPLKEVRFILNTSNSGKATYVTRKISGFLKAILIDADLPIDIIIKSNEFDKLILWEKRSFSGQRYLPLRVGPISNNDEMFQFTHEEYVLNEPLEISIKGSKFAQVIFIIRYT